MENDNLRPDLDSLRIDKSKRYNDRPRGKAWLYLTLTVVVVAIIVAFSVFRKSVVPALKVKAATVAMISGSDAAANLVATGYVVAQRKAEVASKGTGRLVKLEFEEGDTVTAGQIIAVLDNEDIKANLQQAKAELGQAEVDTTNTGRIYRRSEALLKSGAVTSSQADDAEAAYKTAVARAMGAAAAVKTAEVNVENTYIRAPFSGTVLTKNAEVGEIVAPFASSASSKGSVVTLADMRSLEVEADVSESNINKVVIGQPCEIVLDAYPTVRYRGHVKKIVPTADRARATVLTKVVFDGLDDRVLPEMSARVNFFLDSSASASVTAQMLSVPKDAITSRNGQKVVFVIDGDYVTQMPVSTGREAGKTVEIIQGLSAGQRVVLSLPERWRQARRLRLRRRRKAQRSDGSDACSGSISLQIILARFT